MEITIKSVHITEQQDRTWGRVYIQYEQNEQEFYIFKNWLFFDEKTYKGIGNLCDEVTELNNDENPHHVYLWFTEDKRYVFENYKEVLQGNADHLKLTSENYKIKYGTPSIILKRLLIELRANLGEPVEYRKGWFQRYENPEIILSEIVVNEKYKIHLPLYENLELKMEPMLRLVYILFLHHPEGIRLKEISNYKLELESIYSKISSTSDLNKIKQRIEELTSLTKNSLYEKISKINKIVKDELGDKIALHYQIIGNAGQSYKINLEKVLIVFKGKKMA